MSRGRCPLLVWFAQGERILAREEQAAILARLRTNPDRMRWRSLRFWLSVDEAA